MVEKIAMDRRELLLGGISAAALGAFVKPAPTPFVEGSVEVIGWPERTLRPFGTVPQMIKLPTEGWVRDECGLMCWRPN